MEAVYVRDGLFDYLSDSTDQLITLFNYLLIKQNKNKADSFKESIALRNLAGLSAHDTSDFFVKKKKSAHSKTKQVKQVLYNCPKSYGLISVHTFSIPIVKTGGDFFYDREGPDGGFNLYHGTKEQKRKMKEDFAYVPLDVFSYGEITEKLEKGIRTSGIKKGMSGNRTCVVGYHFFIDKKSVNRNAKVPHLNCIVFLGHKRMPRQRTI